jgi:phosphotriesterase-related protein
MKTLKPFLSFSSLNLRLCFGLCLSLCLFLSLSLLISCNTKESLIITVTGEIPASEIGKTLHHEHLLVDFIGADSTGYHRWDKNEVVEKVSISR